MGVRAVTTGSAGSDPGGGLELVDDLAGLGDREVLGARDVVLVAQEALQVGVLGAGDRDDGAHLARRGRRGRRAAPAGSANGRDIAGGPSSRPRPSPGAAWPFEGGRTGSAWSRASSSLTAWWHAMYA